MAFLANNWWYLIIVGLFVFMMIRGGGCCGGHSDGHDHGGGGCCGGHSDEGHDHGGGNHAGHDQGKINSQGINLETDPVCGMNVDPNTAIKEVVNGETYYFCSESCRQSFLKNKR